MIAYVNDNIFRLINELRELEDRTEKKRLQDLKNTEDKIGQVLNVLRNTEMNWEAKLSGFIPLTHVIDNSFAA